MPNIASYLDKNRRTGYTELECTLKPAYQSMDNEKCICNEFYYHYFHLATGVVFVTFE